MYQVQYICFQLPFYSNNFLRNKNNDYLIKNVEGLNIDKPVDKFNSEQIYEHTVEMLIGIDIVINSNKCVLDYESNVSRFIKIAHNNSDFVFDINGKNIDMNSVCFPAYGF